MATKHQSTKELPTLSSQMKSVKVAPDIHRILSDQAKRTGRKIQWVLERAVLRAYGGNDGQR